VRAVVQIREEEQVLRGPNSAYPGEEFLVRLGSTVQCHPWSCDHGTFQFCRSQLLELLRGRHLDFTVSRLERAAEPWNRAHAMVFRLYSKQLSLVYVGTAFNSHNSTTHAVSIVTLMLTIVGTGVAAVYIYYQMRIYLLKKERYDRALQLELDGRDGDPEMVMVDNTAPSAIGARRSLDGREMREYSLDGSYRDEICPASAYKRAQETKATRRPFLHSNSSFGVFSGTSTPSRSKSLHERDGSAISEYLRTKRMEQATEGGIAGSETPMVVVSSAVDDHVVDPGRTSESNEGDRIEPLLNPFRNPTSTATRPRSDTNASNASGRLLQQYNEIVEAADVVRGTASLDLWRPADMSLHRHGQSHDHGRQHQDGPGARSRSPPVSGREIAEEADQFAALRGAPRPELGRTRGESSAALLGRPDLDD
jgi:hypothetical protein